MKDLSIVVASQNASTTIAGCLEALELQNHNGAAEIIVVDNSRDRSAQIVKERFRRVRALEVSGARLIPELWAHGAEEATGNIVAFTTAHCIPDAEWIAQLVRHHQLDFAGVGGAIENRQPSSLTQWAVYFCRYSGYMPPFVPHAAPQIPGDNGSYKRWVLEQYADLTTAGFWETVINDRLRRDGHALLLTAEVRVYHRGTPSMWEFCRQRFTHGRLFGLGRASAASPTRRFVQIIASPFIPVVFLAKITRQVIRSGQHRGAFLRSLPLLALFAMSWSLGEAVGYLQGRVRGSGTIPAVAKARLTTHR